MSEQSERGRGRPATGRGTRHIDLTLSLEVLDFLAGKKERDPKFSKSAFVDQSVRKEIEWERQKPMRKMDLSKEQRAADMRQSQTIQELLARWKELDKGVDHDGEAEVSKTEEEQWEIEHELDRWFGLRIVWNPDSRQIELRSSKE